MVKSGTSKNGIAAETAAMPQPRKSQIPEFELVLITIFRLKKKRPAVDIRSYATKLYTNASRERLTK